VDRALHRRTREPAPRPDGKPNRPITMFDVMVVPIDLGELPSILPAPEPAAPPRRAESEAESSSGCTGFALRLGPGSRLVRRCPALGK
jgi:hypothetical protein